VIFLLPILWGGVQIVTAPNKSERRKHIKTAVIILAVTLIMYLPLYLTLRADPSLQQRVDQLAGPLAALRQGDFGPIWQMTVATLGVFSFTGDPRWTYSLPGRPFFDAVPAVLFYLGLFISFLRLRQPKYALILIWLAVGLLPSAVTPQAPSTVRLVGAMPVVYLFVGTAVSSLVSWVKANEKSTRFKLSWLTGIFLLAILLGAMLRTKSDGFTKWPGAFETRLKYQSVIYDMAKHWQADPTNNWVVAETFFEPIDADSLRRNLGNDVDARWVQTGPEWAGAIVFPNEKGVGRLYVPEFAAVSTDLLRLAGVAERPLFRSGNQPSFAVYELPEEPPVSTGMEPVVLDGRITLLGYSLMPLEVGRPLRLFSYWRVEAELPADLSAFAHLLQGDGSVLFQHDGWDAAPGKLHVGDVIVQRHVVMLPGKWPEEPLTLQLGLYTRGDDRRFLDGNGRDAIKLRENWVLTETE
jgi:hypothetical protein